MFRHLKNYTGLMLTGWLITGILSLGWNLYDDRKECEALALRSARIFVVQMNNMSSWNAMHKGVYVPVTEETRPNPFLRDSKRDVSTRDGLQLTKINPAYMLRQISEIGQKKGVVSFHLTSLNPIRPANKPLPWETEWLHNIQDNSTAEQSRFYQDEKGSWFRYMVPLIVKPACLTCHAQQGYEVGDIRGGVSLTLPMEPPAVNWVMILSHLLAMVAGGFLIVLFGHRQHLHRQQLQEARDTLDDRVNRRTLELSLANRELNCKIHERAKMEKALSMIYDEFYQLFNFSPDGMLVIDENYHILRVNQALCNLLGKENNNLIGRTCYSVLGDDTCRSADCPLSRVLKGEKRVEVEALKQIGEREVPCITSSTAFREQDGTLLGVIQVVKEISRQKKTEQALIESINDLARSNQALEEFAHVISHDLQEPLVLIQAFSNRLQKKAGNDLPKGCDKYLHHITGSAARMQALVRGLLECASVNSTSDSFEEVSLDQILRAVLDDLALRIEKTGAIIKAGKLPKMVADPLTMRQLFQNLVGNSIKYRRKDVRHQLDIEVQSTVEKPGRIQIIFRDNGIGFPEAEQEKIFELFARQADSAASTKGAGIGLAICKKIVQQHQGSITAQGEPGQGAVFTVVLPLSQAVDGG